MEIKRLAMKLLGPPEKISGCSPRACRWTIFGNHHFTLHLYRFIGDGWRRANDYPKQFISVGLVKPYVEEAANEFEVFPDLVGWMLLIGKRSQDSGNRPLPRHMSC